MSSAIPACHKQELGTEDVGESTWAVSTRYINGENLIECL